MCSSSSENIAHEFVPASQHVFFDSLGWFVRLEVGNHATTLLLGCCFQDLFKTVHSLLAWFPSSLFTICLVSTHVVDPYSSTNTAIAWKKAEIGVNEVVKILQIPLALSICMAKSWCLSPHSNPLQSLNIAIWNEPKVLFKDKGQYADTFTDTITIWVFIIGALPHRL